MIDTHIHRKIKRYGKYGLKGICECGNIIKFKPEKFEEKSISPTLLNLKEPILCEQCGETYSGLYDNQLTERKQYSVWGICTSIVLVAMIVIGGYKVYHVFSQPINHENMSKQDKVNVIKNEQNKWDTDH